MSAPPFEIAVPWHQRLRPADRRGLLLVTAVVGPAGRVWRFDRCVPEQLTTLGQVCLAPR